MGMPTVGITAAFVARLWNAAALEAGAQLFVTAIPVLCAISYSHSAFFSEGGAPLCAAQCRSVQLPPPAAGCSELSAHCPSGARSDRAERTAHRRSACGGGLVSCGDRGGSTVAVLWVRRCGLLK